jgi:hypothetical protein
MTTISTRGWRRNEPGLVSAIEQPSLLSRAVELLETEGVDESQLIAQCRVPVDLFRTVMSRTPDKDSLASVDVPATTQTPRGRVVSLLEQNRLKSRNSQGLQ